MAKRKSSSNRPGAKTKKNPQKAKGTSKSKKRAEKKRQEVQSEAKLIKGLDNVCSQLSVLDVSKQPSTSREGTAPKAPQSAADAFKKSPLKPEAINIKLVKSLKTLTCQDTAEQKEGSSFDKEESSDFYQRQWSEFKKYSRRQGKKLRISQRKQGKTYRLLQDLDNTET